MLDKNEFGNLVKAYRNQRGLTQAQVGDLWGHTGEYVSQIERGRRKLDSDRQVARLADILDIPAEKLDDIGRGVPTRQKRGASGLKDDDSAVIKMLLAPGRDMVRLAYLVWLGDQHTVFGQCLADLAYNLDQALTAYNGEFAEPARQLLAYTHQMLGRISLDRLDLAGAAGHFSEVIDLGQSLNDADVITIGMAYQGSILRKRGRFDIAARSFEAARPFAEASAPNTRGVYHLMYSTVHADAGKAEPFEREIGAALDLATSTQESIDGLANDFSLDDVLWSQAGGYSELWLPDKALEVYGETDKLRPFRPMREQGAYLIDKGEAFLRLGELEQGINLSLAGLRLAEEYKSKRQIGWLEKTYSRLLPLSFGKDKRLADLREALAESRRLQASW